MVKLKLLTLMSSQTIGEAWSLWRRLIANKAAALVLPRMCNSVSASCDLTSVQPQRVSEE